MIYSEFFEAQNPVPPLIHKPQRQGSQLGLLLQLLPPLVLPEPLQLLVRARPPPMLKQVWPLPLSRNPRHLLLTPQRPPPPPRLLPSSRLLMCCLLFTPFPLKGEHDHSHKLCAESHRAGQTSRIPTARHLSVLSAFMNIPFRAFPHCSPGIFGSILLPTSPSNSSFITRGCPSLGSSLFGEELIPECTGSSTSLVPSCSLSASREASTPAVRLKESSTTGSMPTWTSMLP
jgi:hypothetical protein